METLIILIHNINGIGWSAPLKGKSLAEVGLSARQWGKSPLFGINTNENTALGNDSGETKEAVDCLLNWLATNKKLGKAGKICIVCHDAELELNGKSHTQLYPGNEEWKPFVAGSVAARDTKVELWAFMHTDTDVFGGPVLLSMKKGCDLYEELSKAFVSNKTVNPREVFKHQIGHLLLSLDIDIQGLIEFNNSNPGSLIYFKDVKKRLMACLVAYAAIEEILKPGNGFSKKTKGIREILKSGKNIFGVISGLSGGIDVKLASGSSRKKIQGLIGFLKKDVKNGSNKFHEWFKIVMGAVDKCYNA